MAFASKPNLMDYALLVILASIFGASFMMTKVALVEIPAASLVAFRLSVAFVIFAVISLVVRQSAPAFGRAWFSILAAAIFGNALPFFLISWGQERVDAGLAAILMAVMPLMTIVLAHFVTRDEKLTGFRMVGFVLGLLGVVMIIGFDRLGTLGEETVRQYAIAGAALCYAIASIVTKNLVKLPRVSTMAMIMALSALLMMPLAIADGHFLEAGAFQLNRPFMIALGLAVLPTALGSALVFIIVDRQGAGFLSQINFLVPVSGVLWATILLSETIPSNAWSALAVILAGVALARIGTKSPLVKETIS